MIKRLLQVKVSLSGENSSIVISRLQKDGVTLKNVFNKEKTTFMICYADLFALRKAVRKTGLKVSLSSEGTIHHVYRFTKVNVPSIGAFLLAVFIFFQAFQYIWSVDITGATPELRDKAEELLIEKGIKPGVRHIALKLDQQSASILYKEIDQLSWSEFERSGSKLKVTLREKDTPQDLPPDQQAHIVASKTGTIHTLSVSSGTPVVKRGDVVKKGEMLVSGYIGREGYEKGIRADGSVKAITWYTVSVSMPEKNKIKKVTGKAHSEYALQFRTFKTPFLSYKRNSFNNQIRQTSEHPISLFGYTLPFMLVEHKYKEVSQSDVNFSKEQSVRLLKEIAEQDVLSFTDGGGQVLKEKILHEDIENGKVKLTIFYEVLENIAATKPFTEETRE